MTFKRVKKTIVTWLGFKSSSTASKVELEQVRKDNADLRRTIAEMGKRLSKPPYSENTKLLKRILELETLQGRKNQKMLVKEQELETMRQQLSVCHLLECPKCLTHYPVSPYRDRLDETFLECPGCLASYPVSRHRDLLAHIDYCLELE